MASADLPWLGPPCCPAHFTCKVPSVTQPLPIRLKVFRATIGLFACSPDQASFPQHTLGVQPKGTLLQSSKLLPDYRKKGPVLSFLTATYLNRSQPCNSGHVSHCRLSLFALHGYSQITVNIPRPAQSCKEITENISQRAKTNTS